MKTGSIVFRPRMSWRTWRPLLFTLLLVMLPAASSYSQITHDPDHEDIQIMCEQATAFLANYSGTNVGDDAAGERVLCALTILEVSKRYEGKVPRDHPLIIAAVEESLTMINGGGRERLDNIDSMYHPCLAMILLCEVDDVDYAPEIKRIVDWISERQNTNGGWGYARRPFICDTSQSQYACLALFIAKHHKFRVNYQTAKRGLDFLTGFQTANGSWYYHYTLAGTVATRREETPSLHCSGLGSVYLLADLLQLSPRSKNMSSRGKGNNGLPPSVTIYVKPKPGEELAPTDKPLVTYDRGKITSTKARGNRWIGNNFTVNSNSWNYYYLYALERYAFFREQSEGGLGDLPTWYDQGVDFLKTQQQSNGSFPASNHENVWVGTALATLFLVRSSQILIRVDADSTLGGAIGFPERGVLTLGRNGLQSQAAIKNVSDLFELLNENDGEDARALIEAAKITASSIGKGKSRAERLALLTGMVKERNWLKRLIAIKVLAGEQNMDNVPALLYALGDPTIEIARKAHDGLRLISRRIDAFPLGNDPTYTDFKVLKKRWTEWFLAIRPDAQLID